MADTTYYIDSRVLRTENEPGPGDLINSVNLSELIASCVNGSGSLAINTGSPLTGDGSATTPATLIDGTSVGQILQWNGGSWGLVDSITSTFLGLTDTPSSFTDGDIYYASGGNLVALPSGNVNQVLTVSGGGVFPAWQDPASAIDSIYTLSDTPAASVAGSIYYGDGSDFVELLAGNAGQQLILNGSATAPLWADRLSFNGTDGVTDSIEFGTVPIAAAATDQARFLRGDGTWAIPVSTPDNLTTGTLATATTPRLANFGGQTLAFTNLDTVNVTSASSQEYSATNGSVGLIAAGAGTNAYILNGSTNISVDGTNINFNPNNTSGAVILGTNADPDGNISAPINSMISYDSTDHDLRAYINGAWVSISNSDNFVSANLITTAARVHTINHDLTLTGTGGQFYSSVVGALFATLEMTGTTQITMAAGNTGIIGEIGVNTNGTVGFSSSTGIYNINIVPSVTDSDASSPILVRNAGNGNVQLLDESSLRVLTGSGIPGNGTQVAYFVNQLYLDTATDLFYKATSKSTNPDSAATGSVWAALTVAGGSDTYAAVGEISLNTGNAVQATAGTGTTSWKTAAGSSNVIDFSTLEVNESSGTTVDTANDRIEIVTAGTYTIHAKLVWSGAVGTRFAQIVQNGTTVLDVGGAFRELQETTLLWTGSLAATDTIDLRFDADYTSNLLINSFYLYIRLNQA